MGYFYWRSFACFWDNYLLWDFYYRGVKGVGNLQTYMVGLLVSAVFLIGGGTSMSSVSTFANLEPLFAPGKSVAACVMSVLAIAPFLFVGFDTIPQAAEEYDFPASKAYQLIVWAISLGGVMYCIVLLSTGMVFPWQELVAAKHSWATGAAMETAIGKAGIIFTVTAVCMGICTGINGFYMATSRLLFSMGRAKVLPAWFTKVDESGVPGNAVIFTALISLICPFFGRKVLIWVVDMCALGTAFGYAYTCFAARLLVKKNGGVADSQVSFGTGWGLLGGIFSLAFMGLLCIPGSPGFMAIESWIALAGWLAMGAIFYFSQAKSYSALPKKELDYLILGSEDGKSIDEIAAAK